MGIVFAAVAPHGFPVIPELSDDAEGALETRAALQELGRRCAVAGTDVIVIAGPHGVRVDGFVALANTGRAAGTLTWQDRSVEMNVPIDMALTNAIAFKARAADIPIAMTGFAGNRRDQAVLPLDWGMLTPLWFLGHDGNEPGSGNVLAPAPDEETGPPVVLVSPSRALPRETLIAFGRAVADAAAADGRKVAFIASCDWAHTHREDGPYGFHASAAEVDGLVVNAIERNALNELSAITDRQAAAAAIDGLWQTLMLQGVLERVPMDGELLSYEAPSYYGMLVASWSAV
jgi:aromatic ring-opening dioxygenase LigB subunit